MIPIPNNPTVDQAREYCRKLSLEHPGKYILLVSCFGAYAEIHTRLHVNAPCDAHGFVGERMYWLNGKGKLFTENQIIADQNATPTMS